MCKFCTEHGDGKIWYKNAANYSMDLVSDLDRRRYIDTFFEKTIREGFNALGRLEDLQSRKGRLPDSVAKKMHERAKKEHFGQVLPIEEIREVVMKAIEVVRMPCACRWTAERKEERCCYGITCGPDAWYKDIDMSYFGVPATEGLERVSSEEAVRQMEYLEEKGAVHTIWTMITPFIAAVCNCSAAECLSMRTLSGIGVELMARAEFAAVIDKDACTGCGLCEQRCQFGAIRPVKEEGRVFSKADHISCFGCGLCRNVCPSDAIRLVERRA